MEQLQTLKDLLAHMRFCAAVGTSKKTFLPCAKQIDTLTLNLLRSIETQSPERSKTRSGEKLKLQFNGAAYDKSAAANLPIIASSALKNLDERFRHDFGTFLFENKFAGTITGTLDMRDPGSVYNTSDDPKTIAKKEMILRRQMCDQGLVLDYPKNRPDGSPVLAYDKNKNAFDQYFRAMHAQAEYFVRSNIIEKIIVHLPIDRIIVWDPDEDPAANDDQMREADVFALKDAILDYGKMLEFSFTSDGVFRQTSRRSDCFNAFANCALQIEEVFGYDGRVRKKMDESRETPSSTDPSVTAMQRKRGLRLLRASVGNLGASYKKITEIISAMAADDDFACTELYFTQYGATRFKLSKSENIDLVLTLPGQVPTDADKRKATAKSIETAYRLLEKFQTADAEAAISSIEFSSDGTELNAVSITMHDLHACDRLIDCAEKPEQQEGTEA